MNFTSLYARTEIDANLDAKIGGLVGLLIGDAVGLPFEFIKAELIPARHLINIQPPFGFDRSHDGIPAGTWSDVGAQALCLLASLLETPTFSIKDFSQRLVRWMTDGYMAVDGHVFDIGIQTENAIERIRDGVPIYESGGKDEYDNGNGSLVRCLPIALLHSGDVTSLVIDAHAQSLSTHAHPRSMVCCAFYCLMALEYLNHSTDPWQCADTKLEHVYRNIPNGGGLRFQTELEVVRNFGKTHSPQGSGYVVDTLWSAKKAMEENLFVDVVRTAIMFGNDTDSTAAVAGGLAGIRFGLSGIPVRWLSQVRGFEIIEQMVTGFLDSRRTGL